MLYTSPWAGVEPTTSVVIDTDFIGSCESNYHAITATTAPYMEDYIAYMYISKIVQNICKAT